MIRRSPNTFSVSGDACTTSSASLMKYAQNSSILYSPSEQFSDVSVKIPWLLAGRVKMPSPGLTEDGLPLRWFDLTFDESKRRATTEQAGDCIGVERISSDPQCST